MKRKKLTTTEAANQEQRFIETAYHASADITKEDFSRAMDVLAKP